MDRSGAVSFRPPIPAKECDHGTDRNQRRP
jgi:hypothetical protein